MYVHVFPPSFRVSDVLDKCSEKLSNTYLGKPVNLEFEGVSTFGGGRVLYACVQENEGLHQLHHISGIFDYIIMTVFDF